MNLCYKDTYVHNCKTIEFSMIYIFERHIQNVHPSQRTLINKVIGGGRES